MIEDRRTSSPVVKLFKTKKYWSISDFDKGNRHPWLIFMQKSYRAIDLCLRSILYRQVKERTKETKCIMVNRVELELAGRTLSLETGKVAKQADAAVWVQYGDTVI